LRSVVRGAIVAPDGMDPINAAIAAAFVVAAFLFGGIHVSRRKARQRRDAEVLEEKRARGAHLARSLHPVIDPDVCIGSLSCLKACPEGDILGVVDGAARLVHGDHCIGHGRCAVECPVHAVKLVFGSAERGIDLPEIDEYFESSRPGVHVVGELGGMGLIKNAVTQGLQLAERLADVLGPTRGQVVVVGAGPAGLATAIGLKARKIPHRLLEQDTLGGSVAHYPRRKVTMTETIDLPLGGRFGKSRITKEELLGSWQKIVGKVGIKVEEGVKVTGVAGEDGRFAIDTSRGTLQAAKVVLAIGRRGTPRKLGVPGEEGEKVLYGLKDPDQFDGNKVLVVGGGDAALEAAIQLAEESSAEVALSYRGAELGRCREANREKFIALAKAGRVRSLLPSVVKEIKPKEVALDAGGREVRLPNDFVVVNVGGELPAEFLAKVGVTMRRYHGEERRGGRAARTTRKGAVEKRTDAEKGHGRTAHQLYALGGLLILAGLAWVGRDYYLLSRAERLASPLHPSLKPAGSYGHGVGIAATLFMLSNFLYAARKRWKVLAPLGKVTSWLDFHVFVGFMSPLVIAFHAAFQSNNLLATGTAASLAVVVSTGIVGRFIYSVVPSDGGKSIELADLLARFERARTSVGDLPARAAVAAKAIQARVGAPVKSRSFAVLFVALPVESLGLRLRLFALRWRFGDRARFKAFRTTVLRLERLRWQIRFYSSLKRLLRGWRAFHATLAVLLVLAIAAHIGLSLYLGYGLLR
jgi:thioredoxin reductase/Pyruvate/2-oxoacid:ferredoxin oxidoreductase delta subunit